MPIPWVKGRIVGRLQNGRIDARVVDRHGMPERPKSFAQSGASREIFERLISREGELEFETFGFLGGAVAWILPTANLEILPNEMMGRLEQINGEPLPAQMFVGLMRNISAPNIFCVAEPAGGMLEDPAADWLLDLLDEGCELGLYNAEGWLGFKLPFELESYQVQLDEKQAAWWRIVRPGLPRARWAQVELLPIGVDTLDGEHGIILPSLEYGEWQLLKVATLHLEGKQRLLDLECRRDGDKWSPLERKVFGVSPREGRSPMFWQFAPDGGLDQCGPHFPLAAEVAQSILTHLSKPLLGPLGLNWLAGS